MNLTRVSPSSFRSQAAQVAALGLLTLVGTAAAAALSMTSGGAHQQSFDSLPSSGSATWTDDVTLPGWQAERSGSGSSIVADHGTNSAGNLYSYGPSNTIERALGSVGATTPGDFAWGVQFRNTNTVAPVVITNIQYVGEQWRNGGSATPQALLLGYRVSASVITSLTPGNEGPWTVLPAGIFFGPVASASPAALNGNDPANRQTLTLDPQIVVPPDGYVMIRWSDQDHSGNDHGLAIDSVRVNWKTVASPVTTEPASSITATSAVLAGTAFVIGNVTNLDVSFEYGLTTNYGSVVAGAPGSVGSTSSVAFSAVVTGLQPSALHHFRAVATNGSSVFIGADRTFFTPGTSGNVVNAIAVMPGNRLIVGGSFTNLAGTGVRNLALLNSNGTVEAGFRPEIAGEVHALAVELDGRIVVGGEFTHVNGVPRNNIFRIATNGTLDLTFDPDIGGPVYALRSEISRYAWPSNDLFAPNILAGGRFSRVGTNTLVRSFARLASGGSLIIAPFAFEFETNQVFHLAAFTASLSPSTTQPAGTIRAFDHSSFPDLTDPYDLVVAGSFGAVGPINTLLGQVEINTAVLNLVGQVKPDCSLGTGLALATVWQPDGNVLVGGRFTQMEVSGVITSRNNLGRSDDPAFNPNPDGAVQTIALQADGRIIIGGSFSNLQPHGIGPVFPRYGLARIEADGSIDPGFAPQFDGEVMSVALGQDGRIAVGGRFATVNGSPSPLFAILTNDPPDIALFAQETRRTVLRRNGSEPELSGAVEMSTIVGSGVSSDGITGMAGQSRFYGILLEVSIDGGATWFPDITDRPLPPTTPETLAGAAMYRETGGYYATNVMSDGTLLRARGYTTDGSGSQGLVETIGAIRISPFLQIERLDGTILGSGSNLDFGATLAGLTNTRTLRMRNTGVLPVTNLIFAIGGPAATNFSFSSITSLPLVAFSDPVTFVASFAPGFIGVHTASFDIVINASNHPNAGLTGKGVTAAGDEDGDGLSNAAEVQLAASGFDVVSPNPVEIATLRSNGLFRATDLQTLAGEPALIARDPGTGQFKLTFGVQRSTNLLQSFDLLPMSLPQLQITPQGRVEFRFSDPADAAFYYIDSAP